MGIRRVLTRGEWKTLGAYGRSALLQETALRSGVSGKHKIAKESLISFLVRKLRSWL